MRVRFRYVRGVHGVVDIRLVCSDAGIDALSEHVHELASVAWDRDCADAVVEAPSQDVHRVLLDDCALRLEQQLEDSRVWRVYTGPLARLVARWDPDTLRWERAP